MYEPYSIPDHTRIRCETCDNDAAFMVPDPEGDYPQCETCMIPKAYCEQCEKEVKIVTSTSGTGFAGGNCHYETYDCGHGYADEDDDIRAAI